MTKKEIAKAIYDTAHITGTFTLRSGQVSDEYFDKYLFEAKPELLKEIAALMAGFIPGDTDILAGLELGGVPIATVLSMQTGKPAAFVRKKAKDYGTCKLAEGAEINGRNVCVIEDVVTTGGAIIDGVRSMREKGAVIDTVLCVILRDERAYEILKKENLALIPAFTMAELTP